MIVVTGGAGFIGSVFVAKLNDEGIDDIIVVDELGTSEKWKNLVKRRYADYLDKDAFLGLDRGGPGPLSGRGRRPHGGLFLDDRTGRRLPDGEQLPLLLPPG